MKDLVLLKIGGSVCTEKGKNEFKVKTNVIARIAREIADARNEKPFRLLLVNGAGPFGHTNVKEYDINDGLHSKRDYDGFVKTISDCHYLNWKVSDVMRKEGLLAVPYPTTSVVIQSDKKITTFFMDVIKSLWDANPDIIPVMNGDMVPDMKLKGSVTSGDTVIEHIADRFRPKLIVLASDVDGIFTGDPAKDKRAKLIDGFTKDGYGDIKKHLSGSSNTDVTGGMLGKIEKLLDLKTPSVIVNGNVPGRVKRTLLGMDVKSTKIG